MQAATVISRQKLERLARFNFAATREFGRLSSRLNVSFIAVMLLSSCTGVEHDFRLQSWEKNQIAAERALKKKQYKLALTMALESVDAAKFLGDSDFRLGVSLCVLGDAQRANKRTKAAEAAYKESIIVLERARNEKQAHSAQKGKLQLDKDTLNKLIAEDQSESLSRLGDLYMAQEKFSDAARCFEMAVNKIQKLDETSQVANGDLVIEHTLINCLLGLARSLAQAEKLDMAQQAYQRAVFLAGNRGCGELFRREIRDEYLKFLKERNNERDAQGLVADVLFVRSSSDGALALSEGNFTAAEIAFRNALVEAGHSVFYEQRVLHGIANLIVAFAREGKTDDVIRCGRLANSFMLTHPQASRKDYDHIQELLANYYFIIENYPLAQEALSRQLEYRVRQYGSQSKEVCSTYAMLGFAAFKNRNPIAAKRCAVKAFNIINSRPEDRSLFYAIGRTKDLFMLLNSFPEMETLEKRMIAIKAHGRGNTDPFVIGLRVNLLVLYQLYNKRTEAYKLANEIIRDVKTANQAQRIAAFPYVGIALNACLTAGWDDLAQPLFDLTAAIEKNDLDGYIADAQVKENWQKVRELASKRLKAKG